MNYTYLVSSVLLEEREIAPHRYTLLTDALSSDDESCTEWQAMKAELSDWNITTKNKSSKKRKKRRKKKKGAQTASCPDQFDVKLDTKQGCTLWVQRVLMTFLLQYSKMWRSQALLSTGVEPYLLVMARIVLH